MSARQNPTVAVMLSTYNGERFLREQLDSLVRQEDVDVLLHARDDGSRDGTCDILRSYADRWPSLVAVGEGPNLGVAQSFMEVIRTAPESAEFFAFCDQDDVWLDDKLARATQKLGDVEGPALYCSVATLVDENLAPLGRTPTYEKHDFASILFANFAMGCTIVMNREALELIRSRLPRSRVSMHDWWCATVVAAFGTIVYDREPGILYRQHGNNVVGIGRSLARERVKLAARLLRSPRSFYLAHDQASEFDRCFGQMLASDERDFLQAFLSAKASLDRRLRYAVTAPVPQNDPIGRIAVRGLIAVGWY